MNSTSLPIVIILIEQYRIKSGIRWIRIPGIQFLTLDWHHHPALLSASVFALVHVRTTTFWSATHASTSHDCPQEGNEQHAPNSKVVHSLCVLYTWSTTQKPALNSKYNLALISRMCIITGDYSKFLCVQQLITEVPHINQCWIIARKAAHVKATFG